MMKSAWNREDFCSMDRGQDAMDYFVFYYHYPLPTVVEHGGRSVPSVSMSVCLFTLYRRNG